MGAMIGDGMRSSRARAREACPGTVKPRRVRSEVTPIVPKGSYGHAQGSYRPEISSPRTGTALRVVHHHHRRQNGSPGSRASSVRSRLLLPQINKRPTNTKVKYSQNRRISNSIAQSGRRNPAARVVTGGPAGGKLAVVPQPRRLLWLCFANLITLAVTVNYQRRLKQLTEKTSL